MIKPKGPNTGLYCKKHNQWYMNFLNQCPICAGEELGKNFNKKITLKKNKSNKYKRKSKK